MTRFSGPDESPGFLLWRVTLAWQRAMRAALAPHDLTHVQFVLLASLWWLENHSGAPSQQRLAEHAGTDPMMTSQVLRKLADRSLVSRSVDPADSRARLLSLTSGGKALVAKAMKDVEDADQAYFAGLGGERREFLRSLTRLL
ncbi:MarR family winged helix-turn-helix transcriptional regulator [Lentzea rhizosphaerae]|uniref:MarR family winged helix-turn-helix transcriptional regulator n=1 Tax=Lentzea rhizosphaerae TaxID=2041025 RepID=A0ABV8C8D2_9PSEU